MWLRALSWLSLLLAAWLTVYCNQPPSSRDASAAPDQFSAERAERWVKALTEHPRPIGSPEAERAYRVIQRELADLGLEVVEQHAPACTSLGDIRRCAHTRNLLGILRGQESQGPAVLLSAHYDSVPSSPGAGDDAAAVAALLETARALKQGKPRRFDVIFAFVDGEEELLLGAAALLHQPDFRRAFLAVNFEARGNRGPSVLIDTTAGNSALIAEVARASSRPALNSLYVALAGVLPNGTDAELYKTAGPRVLSYALADGLPYYHNGTDTLSRLDRRSLQHHGDHALDLAGHFADFDPRTLDSSSEAVFFDVFGTVAVHYPVWLARLMGAVLALAGGLYGWRRRRRSRVHLARLAQGVGAVLGLSLVVALVGFATLHALTFHWPAWAAYQHRQGLIGTLTLLAMFQVIGLLRLATRHKVWAVFQPSTLYAGNLTLWAALTLLSLVLSPATSHMLFWPLVGAGLAGWCNDHGHPRLRQLAPVFFWPAVMFSTLLVRACAVTFGGHAAIVAAVLVVLGGLLVFPETLAKLVDQVRVGRVVLVAGLVLAFAIQLLARADATPIGTSLLHVLEPEKKRAYYASQDAQLFEWHRQFLGADPSYRRWPGIPNELPLHRGPAPWAPIPGPELTVLDDHSGGQHSLPARRVRLRVRSARAARSIVVQELTGAKIERFSFEGAKVISVARISPEADAEFLRRFAGIHYAGRFTVTLHNVAPAGAEMELVTRPGKLQFLVMDKSQGIPKLATTPRPASLTTGYPGDQTWVVGNTLTLE